MPEIPEHLLKRSAERRKQLGLPTGEDGGETPEAAAPEGGDAPRRDPGRDPGGGTGGRGDAGAGGDAITEDKGGVPAHLLERSRRRKAALAGGGAEGAAAPAAAAAARVAPPPRPR